MKMSSTVANKPSEYNGLAFRFEMPKEGLALRAVSIKDGVPKLQFTASKKVPTITEEDVATCIRLSQDHKRPEFFYSSIHPGHPLAETERHYKHYKPTYLRRTSVGELLAEVDWQMKCLNVDVRSDKNRETFHSWSKSSNLDRIATSYDFPRETGQAQVMMTCQSVEVIENENELVFEGEAKMKITDTGSPAYTNYITHNFDSIAYHDEPSFLKIKEIIKLMLAAEWLRDKGVKFSKEWIDEHSRSSMKREAPKPVQVELSPEQVNSIMRRLKKEMKVALRDPALKQPLSVSLGKFHHRIHQTPPRVILNHDQFEVRCERTIPDPFLEATCDRYVPVVQKVVLRATLFDFDYVYQGNDPNQPVTFDFDHETLEPVQPEVASWSELFSETEPFPCKWLQDPKNPMRRTPALTGGVTTSSIPTRLAQKASNPVPVSSRVPVKATKKRTKQRIPSSAIPAQTAVNAPSSSMTVNTREARMNAIAETGSQKMYGFTDGNSSFGVSSDGQTIAKQPSLTYTTEMRQLIGGKEVGPPIRQSMQLPLPPKQESIDSGCSSVANTPSTSQPPQLPQPQPARDNAISDSDAGNSLSEPLQVAQPQPATDDDDASIISSDSGISSASCDTLCSTGSNSTLVDEDMDEN